jgi:hypothetical protein
VDVSPGQDEHPCLSRLVLMPGCRPLADQRRFLGSRFWPLMVELSSNEEDVGKENDMVEEILIPKVRRLPGFAGARRSELIYFRVYTRRRLI